MLCQCLNLINTLNENFWKISLEDLYSQLVEAIRSHKIRFFLPGSESVSTAGSYIMYGSYTRKQIIDIQQVRTKDGTLEYKEIIIKDFRVQRIQEKESGQTHAILNTFFIPYKQYSLRYVLFHIRQFLGNDTTREDYCLTEKYENTFRQWMKWLRDHITVLRSMGLTSSYKDNRKILGQWVGEIITDLPSWTARSLRILGLGLFQDHRMPENTKYQMYFSDG